MTARADLRALDRVTAALQRACAAITDDQWTLATPCTEWTLDQLVDHLTGGNRFTVLILDGESRDAAMATAVASFEGDHHAGRALVESLERQRVAFNSPGALDRICHHVAGDLPGSEVLRLRLQDLIIHAWDVAETIQPPGTLPSELVRWAMRDLDPPAEASGAGLGPLLSAYGRKAQ